MEAAKRIEQNQNEERGKAAEMQLGKWISVEYREEVHEKVQRKVRYLLWSGRSWTRKERRRNIERSVY